MALEANSLNIITAVRYEANTVNAVNKMTFLFDPNWQGIGNTLPICFFYVKDFKEVMESEVSQKQLLFYNSQNSSNTDAVSGGLLGIVADNIINKPKKYQMTVIIPRTVDVYLKQNMFNRNVSLTSLYHDKDPLGYFFTGIDVIARATQDILAGLLQVLGLPSISIQQSLASQDLASWLTASAQDDSNKASLDAMWENRTILKMKYWNGWTFKYVTIENYIPSKDGTEDDYYEATLNVTEVPIMTVRKESKIKTPLASALNRLAQSKKTSELITKFLDKFEDKGLYKR